ncbi:MAG: ABC transporter ATP-binding protein [Solirubrobacterales bacterium]|nr:ABC transporter ATP-binding protein [Solirubrobacterales bacterium]
MVVSEANPRAASAGPDGPPAIHVHNVSKTFRLPHLRYHTLKERVIHPRRFRGYDELRAVQNVSFDVQPGEFFGIVGRNGSGKSTLLKCLAGIYRVDQDDSTELDIEGRLSPFIELGVGFNPDLTARDNVIINAIMLGLSQKEARARFDDVIAFAGLEEFIDLKLKNYSSGMYVRLAFSVAIQVDADVVLIDEVLAVGDSAFQQKCYDEFLRLKAEGKTIVFVTHDMNAVERFCDRAMLLERGEMVALGDPDRVARQYRELNFGRSVKGLSEENRAGDRGAEILDAWVEDRAGDRITASGQGERISLCFEVAFNEDIENPVFGYRIRNEWRQIALAGRSDWSHGSSGKFLTGTRVVVKLRMDNLLARGNYTYTPMLLRAGLGDNALDIREDYTGLIVHSSMVTGGQVDLPYDLEITPAP